MDVDAVVLFWTVVPCRIVLPPSAGRLNPGKILKKLAEAKASIVCEGYIGCFQSY
jgi:hypothetical protein